MGDVGLPVRKRREYCRVGFALWEEWILFVSILCERGVAVRRLFLLEEAVLDGDF